MRTWKPRPPSVVVVDDDPDILKVLGLCLVAEGCVVREASSAEKALDLVASADVVVVDQRMPTMSGTELIAASRARGLSARFLVISGKRGARAEAETAGAEGFLAKPLGMRELLTEVERLFYLEPKRDQPAPSCPKASEAAKS